MSRDLTALELADELLAEWASARRFVAIAGAPGSGKSTTSEVLKDRINAVEPGRADVLMMDAYHFDDIVLDARGHRSRKGAPHTFDVDGLRSMLERLRRDDGRDVAVPVFDRAIEIARAGARIIDGTARIIIVEGNYLLLHTAEWRDLAPLFDLTVMVEASEAEIRHRLGARWRDLAYDPEAITAKLEDNDLLNVRAVLADSHPPDVVIRTDRA